MPCGKIPYLFHSGERSIGVPAFLGRYCSKSGPAYDCELHRLSPGIRYSVAKAPSAISSARDERVFISAGTPCHLFLPYRQCRMYYSASGGSGLVAEARIEHSARGGADEIDGGRRCDPSTPTLKPQDILSWFGHCGYVASHK